MAPELLASLEAGELRDLAAKIREYQTRTEQSDAGFCKKFPELGHTKTYGKIRNGDFDEVDIEGQLASYRTVWATIEAMGSDSAAPEKLYDSVWATVKLQKAFLETMVETSVARCIFLLGPSGSGKTSATKVLAAKYGSRIKIIRANVVWQDKPMAMLGAILRVFGIEDVPMNSADRHKSVVDKLEETRRCLVIEDAHHLGPQLLNLVINLIDETPGEIILPGIDTLWEKIESRAYAECRQLTGNRLADRIVIGRYVRESDCAKMLAGRLQWAGDEETIKKAAHIIAEKANGLGLLSFVREVIPRLVKTQRETKGAPLTIDDLTKAIGEEVASR